LNSSLNDIDLVEKLHKGDVEAFDLLYEKYSCKLYAFGFKYLRTAFETEELVQSVFLKIWENHRNLKKELSFKSYLFTIAYNDICKLFRRRYYDQKFVKEILDSHYDSTSEVEEGIEYQSVLNQIQKIVEKLPNKQKLVFQKSRHEGKSTKEIANELHLSTGTVDNYISEVMKFIRKFLRKENLPYLAFLYLIVKI